MEAGSISWGCGTLMILTLQQESTESGEELPDTVIVQAEVVRISPEGMGLRFLFRNFSERYDLWRFLSKLKSKSGSGTDTAFCPSSLRAAPFSVPAQSLSLGPRTLSTTNRRGQSLIEFSLLFPLLFLLVVNVVNFGTFMYAWITVANAARAGAEYWVTGTATVFSPSTPTAAEVTAVVTKDINSLPNRASLQVELCTNNKSSGTAVITCSGSYGAVVPPNDPESGSFVSATVDVKYTYQPAISLWRVPGLNINATLPSTTIHRQAFMRRMN